MSSFLAPVRRIVTGIDANGRSYIAEDGVAPAMMTMEGRAGYRNNNLWRTVGSPTPVDAADSVLEHRGVLPPPGGTVLRVIDIPPEEKDPVLRKRYTEAVFAAMFADAKHDSSHARHPGMHVTDTIDYAIVLQGELVAIMDEGETVLRAGDILIQRGTNHAWANRSNAITRVAFILIDGRR
jgi:quercetin dioxygenase-like cupin family protein